MLLGAPLFCRTLGKFWRLHLVVFRSMGIGTFGLLLLLALPLILMVCRMSRMLILTMDRRHRMAVRMVVLTFGLVVVEDIDLESIGLEGTDLEEGTDRVCFHYSLVRLLVICRPRVVWWLRM